MTDRPGADTWEWDRELTIILAVERGGAERVARIGGLLAKDLGARVLLAHVRPDPALFNSRITREHTRHSTTTRGHDILRRAHRVLPGGIQVDERVELGNPFTRLAELADEVNAALVVVGTRGRRPLASALFGSVSQTLARQSPCPVMVIPRSASPDDPPYLGHTPPGRPAIVAGVEDLTQSSGSIAFARQLADTLGDRLMIVHLHSGAGPPAHALQAIAASEAARLIVVGAGHRPGPRLPLSGPLAAQLARLAHCPVIVVPAIAAGTQTELGETDTMRMA